MLKRPCGEKNMDIKMVGAPAVPAFSCLRLPGPGIRHMNEDLSEDSSL